VPAYVAGARAPSVTASTCTWSRSPRSRRRCASGSSCRWTATGVANYPDPSAYIPQFFGCGGGTSNGYYCNPQLDREMQDAGRFELSDPARASARWQSIDRQLTDDAVWVPTVNQRQVDLVSKRVRNYECNPV
jgi:ABC-type transport system substrate-binding protein